MADFIHHFVFGIFPYITAFFLIVVSAIRFDRDPYSWRSKSSQMLSKKKLVMGSRLFHIGIILILCGHFVGLLTPKDLYHAMGITTEAKQLGAMIAGGVFGILCFIGMTMLLYRRLFDERIRATSSFADIAILLLLYAQLILGLCSIFISAQHLDGHEMVALANWAQHIVTFRSGAAGFVTDVHWIFKMHIALGLFIFTIFPFTRLVHMWSAPLEYLTRSYQIVRKKS